jgi:predicted RNase H-like nuclease (RuvC/YqgF family)
VLILANCTNAFGQVTFTEQELLQLAEQNLQRKECQELNEVLTNENDTLRYKCDALKKQIQFLDSTITFYNNIDHNQKRIINIQETQIQDLKKASDQNKETIKDQNRKLNFWRIFTPISITAVAILSIFVK